MLRLSSCIACPYLIQQNFIRTCKVSRSSPELFRAFTTSRLQCKGKSGKPSTQQEQIPDSEQPKIRWYQQLSPWATQRTSSDPDLGFAAGEKYDEAKWLKDQIDKHDAEIRDMEGCGEKTLVEPMLAALSKEDAQKIRDAIKQQDLEDERKAKEVARMKRELDAKYLPRKEELEIRWRLPLEQETYLRTLNENMLKASSELSNQELRKSLWMSYIRCKAFLPPFLHLVPRKSWDVLWGTQQGTTPDDPHWGRHLLTIAEDMKGVGVEMSVYQKILIIEALQSENLQERAIAQWQELKEHLGDDTQASAEHELLGVRLFASQGDPEKAEKIALDHLDSEKQSEPQILLPILNAWVERGDDVGIQHAWALYLRFRTLVGSNITMNDYDNISIAFLNVGRTDIALAVFKDMMLTGQSTDEGSLELYKKSLSIMGRAQSSAVIVEDLNRISLTGLIALPRKFQNKFFYGSWLKKLIGMGNTDAAAQVIELMYERGVKPDSKHLNGIVGAWFREGSMSERDRAETMAWAMIHERLDFVSARQRGQTPRSSRPRTDSGLTVPQHLRRTVAPANIETFSLLLQYYGRRAQYENVQTLQDHLDLAEIKPNSYFINHLLYIDLRRGQHQAAWIRYQEMSYSIKPDLETFACLWDCEKAHLDSLLIHAQDMFPGPRRIMYDTMTWLAKLKPKSAEREGAQEDFSKELYDQIIRCMGMASDAEGMIVALYALRQSFGFYPDADTVRNVNISISRLKVGQEAKIIKPGRRRVKRSQQKANAANLSQVLKIVMGQREVTLKEAGLDDIAQFDGDLQKEERLFTLAEFIRTVLRRTTPEDQSVEDNIEKAAWEMGVGGLRMEDPLPSYGSKKGMYQLGDGWS